MLRNPDFHVSVVCFTCQIKFRLTFLMKNLVFFDWTCGIGSAAKQLNEVVLLTFRLLYKWWYRYWYFLSFFSNQRDEVFLFQNVFVEKCGWCWRHFCSILHTQSSYVTVCNFDYYFNLFQQLLCTISTRISDPHCRNFYAMRRIKFHLHLT